MRSCNFSIRKNDSVEDTREAISARGPPSPAIGWPLLGGEHREGDGTDDGREGQQRHDADRRADPLQRGPDDGHPALGGEVDPGEHEDDQQDSDGGAGDEGLHESTPDFATVRMNAKPRIAEGTASATAHSQSPVVCKALNLKRNSHTGMRPLARNSSAITTIVT